MCGVAVITNISHELVKDTMCGILVDYGKVDEIRQAIITLKDNTQLRKFYATNGRQAFLKKYNWTKMEEKLYSIYDRLLNKSVSVKD
jgi:glycosyltransferase involved in cell wall biosynthesis